MKQKDFDQAILKANQLISELRSTLLEVKEELDTGGGARLLDMVDELSEELKDWL